MQKFSSIEQFRTAVKRVRDNANYHGKPMPTMTFEGTVKLHGTNAGVRIRKNSITAQSRERLISIGDDNAGFAHFVAHHEDAFTALANLVEAHNGIALNSGRLTVFGEWCGGNIQSKVGLNQLPKHFVIFHVYDHDTEKYLDRTWMKETVQDDELLKFYHDAGIYFIHEIPAYLIRIDFAQAEQVIEELERLTIQVEERCPWAAYMGAEGIGEGIVWNAVDDITNTNYWFKTKGMKHQGKDQSKVKTLSVDPVKVAAIRELVDQLLPEWRLEQGVAFLRENNYDVSQSATGQYLQWISRDILKEETDTIAANDYTWKELTPHVIDKARSWYFQHLMKTA